ncbi:unnamed protein product, partial [Ilex paraguariensis]
MKHLLRKLHIGGGHFADHHPHPPVNISPPPPPQVAPSDLASSPTDVSATSTSSSALTRSNTAVESAENLNSDSLDFNFFEEEFQVQLALAISVSDPDATEDPDTAQIQKAKQISLGLGLGCSRPSETLVECLSLRYWNYNVINYDERVMDGFYDVYGINSTLLGQGKMPLLVDLDAISVSDNVDYEVIIVNRGADSELRQLEEKVYIMSMECQGFYDGSIMSGLIQKIADLIVGRMGGPVSDAEEMLRRWTARSYELRNSLNTIILPLGCLDVGLSRHRALLFKVLADRINLPCMLVKGSYYTGTDEGAVNFIKVDNGSEFIIDLMGAPGTLIPAEVSSSHRKNSGLDLRSFSSIADFVENPCSVLEEGYGTRAVSPKLDRVAKVGNSNLTEASSLSIQSKRGDKNVVEKNQIERFEHEFGKLHPPLGRSHEGSSGAHEKASAAQKMQVKDVSECVISAAKNPEFAQKLHAVLLENGASLPPDLLSNINLCNLGEEELLENIRQSNLRMVAGEAQCSSDMLLSNNEQSIIPFSGGHWFSAKQQELKSTIMNRGQAVPSDTANEEFVLISSGHKEMSQADDAALCNGFADPSRLVSRASDGEHTYEFSMFLAAKPFEGQPKSALHCDEKNENKLGMVLDTGKDKGAVAKVDVCTTQNGSINPVLGEAAEWEILWEDLQIGERIGIGSFGEVYRGEWNGTEVAVKKFMNQDLSGDALLQFKCEIEIMLRLRHPNVVLFMGAVTRPPNLSILTEFLPRGSLYKLLHRPNVQIDEKRRMRMALDV